MIWLWLSALAQAGTDVALVGVHIAGLNGKAEEEAISRLSTELKAAKLGVLMPGEVSQRLSGKESLAIEDFALGPGRELVKEARILYDRAQAIDALPVITEAVDTLENSLILADSPRDLQDALLLLGMCHLANGDDINARLAFRRAAVLDPSRSLETASYSPEVRGIFDELRTNAATQSPGRLSVHPSIKDATVYVDGRQIGIAPIDNFAVVPGPHTVVVRGVAGSASSSKIEVVPGQSVPVNPLLVQHNLGDSAESATGRSRQIQYMYQGLGRYTGVELILIAGVSDNKAIVQFFDPQSGNFSRAISADLVGDPIEALVDELPSLINYLDANGNIKADKVSTQVASLDAGANSLVAELLLDPSQPTSITVDNNTDHKVPWYLWAGIGAVVVGGGAAGVVIAVNSAPPGYVTLGPIP